jgi:hypothetical protein
LPDHHDRITIALDRLDVVLSWKARTALLDELAQLDAGQGIRARRKGPASSSPATVD